MKPYTIYRKICNYLFFQLLACVVRIAILWKFAGWPGSAHDARVRQQNQIYIMIALRRQS